MPEGPFTSFVQVVLTLSIGGVLLYPLYPAVDALNHTFALFLVLGVALVLGAVVVKEVGGSQGFEGSKKMSGLARIAPLFATWVILTLAVEFLSGDSSLQIFVTLATVVIVVLFAFAMS
ncbi:MAG TPA: hypothetical protein VEB87_07760 [Nitrososphaerales archaeon]|nr:hypothetical protein [Nitrososphaerales archaeon]